MFATAFIIAAVALPQVFAHGGVLSYDIAGTHYPGFSPYNAASGQT
jgi:cellulase